MTTWRSLPLQARIYISTVVVLATPLFLRALVDVVRGSYGNDWLVLAGITLVTVPVFVFLPSVRSLVTIGDAFVISICMMYGTPPAIVANTFFMAFLTLLLNEKSPNSRSSHRV